MLGVNQASAQKTLLTSFTHLTTPAVIKIAKIDDFSKLFHTFGGRLQLNKYNKWY